MGFHFAHKADLMHALDDLRHEIKHFSSRPWDTAARIETEAEFYSDALAKVLNILLDMED